MRNYMQGYANNKGRIPLLQTRTREVLRSVITAVPFEFDSTGSRNQLFPRTCTSQLESLSSQGHWTHDAMGSRAGPRAELSVEWSKYFIGPYNRSKTLRRRIKTHIIRYHTRNRMQTPQIKFVQRPPQIQNRSNYANRRHIKFGSIRTPGFNSKETDENPFIHIYIIYTYILYI
jgi:hypothetical protein